MMKTRWFGLLAAMIGGCSGFATSHGHRDMTWAEVRGEGGAPPIHVVLIAIDGTRWQEIFRGTDAVLAKEAGVERETPEALSPNIHALAAAGISLGNDDQPFEASGPNFISLPGYTEMLTGHAAACQENDCDERPAHTLLDSFRDAGAGTDEVAMITSWERIDNVATRESASVVVSAGRNRSENAERIRDDPALASLLDEGAAAEPDPGHGDYRPDRYTAALATAFLSERRPRFLFVSLGDTDEYGHDGDYAGYLAALRRADRLVGEVMATTARWQAQGEQTMILVTTDHGREAAFRAHGRAHPESARSWLVGAGAGLSNHSLRRGERRHLADIAPTIERAVRIVPRANDETGVPLIGFLSGAGPQ
jgi:hypothetical protein